MGKKNRDERILYALKRGGKTESNREEKRGKKTEKKQKGESFYML